MKGKIVPKGKFHDPKWDSFVDECIKETLTTMGQKLGQMGLTVPERETAKVMMARGLVYAGCTMMFEHTGQEPESTKELIKDSVKQFFKEM